MSEHTPGPWQAEIEEHRASSDRFAAAIGTGNPYAGTYRALARVCGAEHAYDEDETARVEADARLIAAAPDLLAVVEVVALWPHADGECLIVDMARAALQKATGGEG